MPYLLHGNVSPGSCLRGERDGSSYQQTQQQRQGVWRSPFQVSLQGSCQPHTKQPSGQLRDLCDFSWMWTSGEESPWKGLTEAFIRSIHQLHYFKTGFYLCTRPGFTRTKLSVDNYWQHCTLLNTLTEVTQTVSASDAVMQCINCVIWQTHPMHCVSHGSLQHSTPRNSCL